MPKNKKIEIPVVPPTPPAPEVPKPQFKEPVRKGTIGGAGTQSGGTGQMNT